MKRFVYQWLAISSVLLTTLTAAETRPQYGGTLRVEINAAPASLDPADNAQTESLARWNVSALMFDTLVQIDNGGHPISGLAQSWQASNNNRRWQFQIRPGVKFHDGTPLTAELAAASLRTANPAWNVVAEHDQLIIERESSDPELLVELALARNAIVRRDADGKVIGTGPFRVVEWQPGRKLTLTANEDSWRGRPMLDGVEIEMGKSFREQMTALELGKADLVEVAPEQAHRLSQEGQALISSAPVELLALVFTHDPATPEEKTLRDALSLSVDRASMRSVLLQGAGQPTASLLPNWVSGYGFLFSTNADLVKARQMRAQVRGVSGWTLGYDIHDPLARLLAERIALNAKDAGLSLQPTSSASADVRIERMVLASSNAWVALDNFLTQAAIAAPKDQGGTQEELYKNEQAALAMDRVIPLMDLPITYAAARNLKNISVRADGRWNLADAWLESAKP